MIASIRRDHRLGEAENLENLMGVEAGRSSDDAVEAWPVRLEPARPRTARWLMGLAAAGLVTAGLALWWRHGDAVFADVVLAALAWCF